MRYLKLIIITVVVVTGMALCTTSTHAQTPDIEGYLRVAGTNAPVSGVWIKMTNSDSTKSNCEPGAFDQSRYARTDSNGYFMFRGWTQMDSSERDQQVGQSIDTNLDGTNDAIWYPDFSSCDSTESHGLFNCGHDPFSFEVIKPYNWRGSFDSIQKIKDSDTCVFCVNNGSTVYEVPTLYYHPSSSGGGTSGPTFTPRPSSTPVPTSAPISCTITAQPVINVPAGTSIDLIPGNITYSCTSGATIDQMTFTVSNPSVASVCGTGPCSSSSSTYTDTPSFFADITGNTPGSSTTLTVVGQTFSGGGGIWTSQPATITVNVTNPAAWFQSKETSIVTNGSILSSIPTSCIAPSCINKLILYDSSESPGVAIAGGTLPTSVSQQPPYGWKAGTTYNGTRYTYDFFEKKASCGVLQTIATSTIDQLSDLTIGTPSSSGYYWIRYSGGVPLTISDDINIGDQKILLFVENDLKIEGKVTLNNGRGFFMVVASGNILVDPSVGGLQENPAVPDLEGVFFTNGQFKTGTNDIGLDQQLHVRGPIAAFDRIVLERSLANNAAIPAELFEFAPDLLMGFPSCLGDQSVEWKEAAP